MTHHSSARPIFSTTLKTLILDQRHSIYFTTKIITPVQFNPFAFTTHSCDGLDLFAFGTGEPEEEAFSISAA